MESEKFSIEHVKNCFENSLKDEDDIILEYYLEAYKEIYKFFQLMGTVFGFVSSDVKTKIEILDELRQKPDVNQKFVSVKIMMEYEIDAELLKKKEYVSGSRTLLRLHRGFPSNQKKRSLIWYILGLDFVRVFLRNLNELNPEDKTHTACSSAYEGTLANFHPWIIRKSASVAMYAMPTRENLLNKVCCDIEKAILTLPLMLDATDQVYDRVEALYTKYDLHGLP